jgi:hypothetical protein
MNRVVPATILGKNHKGNDRQQQRADNPKRPPPFCCHFSHRLAGTVMNTGIESYAPLSASGFSRYRMLARTIPAKTGGSMTGARMPIAVLRRRWNDPHAARAPLLALREPAIKNDPGGICGPVPRPFPYARIWCDQLIDGRAIHACDPATAPHELQLCVLEADNSPELNAQVRLMLRR